MFDHLRIDNAVPATDGAPVPAIDEWMFGVEYLKKKWISNASKNSSCGYFNNGSYSMYNNYHNQWNDGGEKGLSIR